MEDEWLEIQERKVRMRKATVEATLRPAEVSELRELGEQLFPVHDDWRVAYFEFLDAHPTERYFRAATHEGYQVLYCPAQEKGIWFIPGSGVGRIQPKGLALLKQITAGK